MGTNVHEQFSPMPGILLDALGVGAALVDADSGKILLANELFCRSLQYDVEEISTNNTPFIQLVHPEDRNDQLLQRDNLLRGLVDRCRFESRYLRKDGATIRMRTTQTAIRNSLGRLITCVLDEMTEPANGDAAFHSSNDLASISIWNWIPEGNAGRKAARYDVLLGPMRAVGRPSIDSLTKRVHPDDAKAVQSMLRRSLSGVASSQDYRVRGADGKIFWVREMVTPIKDASGEVTNVVGMAIDITASMNRIIAGDSSGIFSFIHYLESHWDKPLVLSKVAREHKLSVRGLQKYFGARGITPHDFLKRIKLAHAYDMLSNPESRTTVTKVSRRCGFGNLGHFAKDYRNEFGELPSETLLRSRTRAVNVRGPELAGAT